MIKKEGIYENYWRQLVELKRQFFRRDYDCDPAYLNLKKQLEKERDTLLEKYGYKPFQSC